LYFALLKFALFFRYFVWTVFVRESACDHKDIDFTKNTAKSWKLMTLCQKQLKCGFNDTTGLQKCWFHMTNVVEDGNVCVKGLSTLVSQWILTSYFHVNRWGRHVVASCKSIIFNSCFLCWHMQKMCQGIVNLLSAQRRKQVAKVHYMTVYNDGTFNDQ